MRAPLARLALLALLPAAAVHADDLAYQTPPPAIARFVDAPSNPWTSLGPDRTTLLLLTPQLFPSIAALSEPEQRLAGIRFRSKNRSATRYFVEKLELLDARARQAAPRPVTELPKDARIADVLWSPDGRQLAFTHTEADAIRLYVVEVARGRARQLAAPPLHGVFGRPCEWLSDSRTLACRTVPRGAAPPASAPAVPTGPIVQENDGAKRPARTNPDLLRSPADEKLFELHATSQLMLIELNGEGRPIGAPGLYTQATPSPDGKHLLVDTLHRPYSYQVGVQRFPVRTEVWGARDGKPLATIADLPLAEAVPVDFDAARTGRRAIHWRADAPATLCWVEAADGGDPKRQVAVRDTLDCVAAPYTARPTRLISLAHRFTGVEWGSGALALVTEGWWKDRKTRTHVIAPDAPQVRPRVLWDRSSEDRYGDPGDPVTRRTPAGRRALHVTSKGQLLLAGEGATPDGDRPFLDRLDPATGKTERLWRSEGAAYAAFRELLDDDGDEVLLARETPATPPQLHAYAIGARRDRQITRFGHPVPELAKVGKQLIKWRRPDGVELSGMLYLPPGFRPKIDPPLPVLVWVYPQEFKSASAASQVTDSPHRFIHPWWGGPLFALLQGYAVVDDPAFVIVGEGKAEPNDTYVEQLTADAASLIDHVVGLGVGDRRRFAVGGHSYGAFTTANLLAHSDLFAAGIARSGAYNRTLTPFGFQAEERTYWEAAATYDRMSPFRYADQIREPLLLIHGAIDDNAGTYPIQSDRLYAALQGLGGRARYVSLPSESHGYRARESALHVLWEQARWLDAHVKHARPAPKPAPKPAPRPAPKPAPKR